MTTMASGRLLDQAAPVLAPTTATLADLLTEAGAVLDTAHPAVLDRRAATVDALASELAMAAGLHDLAGTNPSVAASLRTLAVISVRTAGRDVAVDPEQAILIRTILAQL